MIGEGEPAEDEGHIVPELADELRVVVLLVGKVRYAIDIGLPVHALVRHPFHVPAVVGQAQAPFQAGPAPGLLGPDQMDGLVIPVQRLPVVIVLEVEIRDADVPHERAGHPAQLPPDGLLERRHRPQHLPMVRVIGRPRVRVEVQIPEIGRMEAVEPIEIVHRRIPVGERSGDPGALHERLGIEQPVQIPRPLRRPRPANCGMVLEIRVIRPVPIVEEIAERAQVQPDVRIVAHIRKRREHPPHLGLLLRPRRKGGHPGGHDGCQNLFHPVSFVPDKDNHFPTKTHQGACRALPRGHANAVPGAVGGQHATLRNMLIISMLVLPPC